MGIFCDNIQGGFLNPPQVDFSLMREIGVFAEKFAAAGIRCQLLKRFGMSQPFLQLKP